MLGIGAAVARAFARSGCTRLALTDINEKSLAQTRDAVLQINPAAQVTTVAGDVSDDKFVSAFAEQTTGTFKRLDYAVNCAGILGESLRSDETPVEVFDRINKVNYRGSWLVARAALGWMVNQEPLQNHPGQRGAVVNVASQLGIVARPGAGMLPYCPARGCVTDNAIAAYCASKAAIINMTRSDAIDYSKDGIRVNCVCPGVIESPMTTGSDEVIERLKPAIDIAPMQRMGKPDEVADAVMFLCSPHASFIQGHALVVDGGYTIN
jgi:NAD(P)-dependent dehydrogenase (short-subunit alcohol dehydrogenase family)